MTTSLVFGVYGASGCGRGVAPLVESMVRRSPDARVVFIDDKPPDQQVNGLPVSTFEQFAALENCQKQVSLAIADSKIRERLAEKCKAAGLNFLSVCAEQHVRMHNVSVGVGAIFAPFTTVTSNIEIGRHFHCNIGSYVEHDCIIGDFVTFAPGVKCNGNIHIQDHAYVGSGAVLKQGSPEKPLSIGAGAVIGMGAVVTKDVGPGETVIGNPARPLSST